MWMDDTWGKKYAEKEQMLCTELGEEGKDNGKDLQGHQRKSRESIRARAAIEEKKTTKAWIHGIRVQLTVLYFQGFQTEWGLRKWHSTSWLLVTTIEWTGKDSLGWNLAQISRVKNGKILAVKIKGRLDSENHKGSQGWSILGIAGKGNSNTTKTLLVCHCFSLHVGLILLAGNLAKNNSKSWS